MQRAILSRCRSEKGLASPRQNVPYLDDLAASSGYKGTAVELGAGVGVPGMRLAQHGWSVVLTDLPVLLPLTALNVEANAGLGLAARGARTPTIAPLRWGCTATRLLCVRPRAQAARPVLRLGHHLFRRRLCSIALDAEAVGGTRQRDRDSESQRLPRDVRKAAEDLGWKVEPATCITYMYGQSKVRSYSCNRCTVAPHTRRCQRRRRHGILSHESRRRAPFRCSSCRHRSRAGRICCCGHIRRCACTARA